jgi:hypothetical protein
VIDFPGLLRALSGAGARFIIVGGAAATAHGCARLTQDLDLVYDRSPENLRRIVSALAPHDPYLRGAPPGLPFSFDVETLRRGLNFTLTSKLGDVDLLGEIVGRRDRLRTSPTAQATTEPPSPTRQRCSGLIAAPTRLIEVSKTLRIG